LENQIDYGVVVDNDFAKYDTVIIPEKVVLDDNGLAALKSYLQNGGKMILMADALVKDGEFQLDFGMQYQGGPQYDCDYLICSQKQNELPDAPMLCNIPGHRIESDDAQVFAEFITPYFSRTYEHFCGHKNTPHNKSSQKFPAIAKKGNVVYLSHSLPREYHGYGSLYHKRYFMLALNLIHSNVLKVKGLGSQGRCTAIHQPDQNRYCVNMVYASPIKRGMAEVVEDIFPVYNVHITLRTDKAVKKVYLALDGQELEFTSDDGEVNFTVPEFECHTSVIVEY